MYIYNIYEYMTVMIFIILRVLTINPLQLFCFFFHILFRLNRYLFP